MGLARTIYEYAWLYCALSILLGFAFLLTLWPAHPTTGLGVAVWFLGSVPIWFAYELIGFLVRREWVGANRSKRSWPLVIASVLVASLGIVLVLAYFGIHGRCVLGHAFLAGMVKVAPN